MKYLNLILETIIVKYVKVVDSLYFKEKVDINYLKILTNSNFYYIIDYSDSNERQAMAMKNHRKRVK